MSLPAANLVAARSAWRQSVSKATTVAAAKPKSKAEQLIVKRATTCSINSVFYLKTIADGCPKQQRQAALVENCFIGFVGVPTAFLGLGGLYHMASNGKL